MIPDQIMKDAIIIDVRERIEFISQHIRGAINIPLSSIAYKVDELKSHGRPLVFYCRSGKRSGQATKFLKSMGIDKVYNGGSLSEMARSIDSLASLM